MASEGATRGWARMASREEEEVPFMPGTTGALLVWEGEVDEGAEGEWREREMAGTGRSGSMERDDWEKGGGASGCGIIGEAIRGEGGELDTVDGGGGVVAGANSAALLVPTDRVDLRPIDPDGIDDREGLRLRCKSSRVGDDDPSSFLLPPILDMKPRKPPFFFDKLASSSFTSESSVGGGADAKKSTRSWLICRSRPISARSSLAFICRCSGLGVKSSEADE